jgi:acetate---CoA ligase (ADP-forming)
MIDVATAPAVVGPDDAAARPGADEEPTMSFANGSSLDLDVVLRDGTTVRIRELFEDDPIDHLLASAEDSIRLIHPEAADPSSFRRLVLGDRRHQVLVAESGARIVAFALFWQEEPDAPAARFLTVTAPSHQGRGIGTQLLLRLSALARAEGISVFEGDILEKQTPRLALLSDSGFEVRHEQRGESIHVWISLASNAALEDKAFSRGMESAAASMKLIFEPSSVAVVGASRDAKSVGGRLFANLKRTGFKGRLFAVNPSTPQLDGVAVARLSEIGEPIDLAVITVPVAHLEQVVDDCIAAGVRAMVVITAGLGETGAEGRSLEMRILDKVRAAGVRLVGPNCLGVINTDPHIRLHASFASLFPPSGSLAMASQSGALGLVVLEHARRMNLGFSTFISVGNKLDVSGNDLIQYWSNDPRTGAILLYLESFGNPQRFSRLARRVSRRKPIIAVKSGRSRVGERAASSHTGALAASDAVVDDLFRQTGIIRTDTVEQMFDVASIIAHQPLPRGGRVAIVTNAGGPGILAADACEANGLTVQPLSAATEEKLRAFLPAAASVGNPIDMIASAPAEHYQKALEVLADDGDVDGVICIYIPISPDDADPVAAALRLAAQKMKGTTLVASFLGVEGVTPDLGQIASFPFPERAAAALARTAHYAAWRMRPEGVTPPFSDFDSTAIREIVQEALDHDREWLDPHDAFRLLQLAGIRIAATREVESAEAAMIAAQEIGFPVALKATGGVLLHKTERNAIRLGLESEPDLAEAFAALRTELQSDMEGAIVQEMIPGGVEVMIGSVRDPLFGHLLVYGAGGTLVELLGDVSFRLQPVTDADVEEMMQRPRVTRLMEGFRGSGPVDRAAVEEALLRLSHLVEAAPEIAELDVNPLKVTSEGAFAVDVRVSIRPLEAPLRTRRVDF